MVIQFRKETGPRVSVAKDSYSHYYRGMHYLRKIFIWTCFFAIIFYGIGRIYFQLTDGFSIHLIVSNLNPDERWNTHPLTEYEYQKLSSILDQEFHYLGKGCQSYAFGSEDGKYVLKFFKYKKFLPKPYLKYFTCIPSVNRVYQKKALQKQQLLDEIFTSWMISYEHLSEESGVAYIHLNKSENLQLPIHIRDKMGWLYRLEADQMEFMVQHKAEMLCTALDRLMAGSKLEQAKAIIDDLVNIMMSEYARGFGDLDHALMQNTGVVDGKPVHVDVGQFVYREEFKDLNIAHQQLYNNTYLFRLWLRKHYPELADYTDEKVVSVIGSEKFPNMKHQLRVN